VALYIGRSEKCLILDLETLRKQGIEIHGLDGIDDGIEGQDDTLKIQEMVKSSVMN